MAVEFTRFYNGARITVSFSKVPPGRLQDWQDFLLDVARRLSELVPEGNGGKSIWHFMPYATRNEEGLGKRIKIKVQLFFSRAPTLPLEEVRALLELLINGIWYVFDQEKDTAWHLGILSADVRSLVDILVKEVMPLQENLAEIISRYGYNPLDTVSKN